MNHSTIFDIPEEAREWMIWATIKVMIADKIMTDDEVLAVRSYIKKMGRDENKLFHYLEATKKQITKVPGVYLTAEEAGAMLMELLEVCCVDSDMDVQEMQFIKKAVSLLGFKPSILKSLGTLQEIYLEQSKIESKFLDGAADHFIH